MGPNGKWEEAIHPFLSMASWSQFIPGYAGAEEQLTPQAHTAQSKFGRPPISVELLRYLTLAGWWIHSALKEREKRRSDTRAVF